MKTLSRDQETLAKIPQLLTSKLPICEFDKNHEKFQHMENDNAAKRIQTASHITPWQMEDRRMDTMMSFDADFNEEPETVLLNFKHLLFAFRWNSHSTLNYLEWLVTVTNDIFFYFLKLGEPMYAYHALKLSEYYIKSVLQQPCSVNQFRLQTQGTSIVSEGIQQRLCIVLEQGRKQRYQELEQKIEGALEKTSDAFKSLFQRKMDPVIEIYTSGLSSVALQAETLENGSEAEELQNLLYELLPKDKSLEEKIETKLDFVNEMPRLVARGDGSLGFQFQKNYILLAYYCLIQFRNYQAGNFNILFLIVSSYIVKNHINASFVQGLTKFTALLLHNFSQLDKTDELDLFFGKCGKNVIKEAASNIEMIRQWTKRVVPHQSVFYQKVLNKSCLRRIHMISAMQLQSKQQGQVNASALRTQFARTEIFHLVSMAIAMQDLNFDEAIKILRQVAQIARENQRQYHMITPTQTFGVCLTLFATQLWHLAREPVSSKSLSLSQLFDCMARQTIKMDKKSPINTISQQSKIYEPAFCHHFDVGRVVRAKRDLAAALELKENSKLQKFTAMLFAYLGDYQKSAKLLKPSSTEAANVDQLVFAMLIQASALKTQSKNYLMLRDTLQDYSMKNLTDLQQLHQTTERLNAMHSIKFVMAEISCIFQRLSHLCGESKHYREYLWACFSMLPLGVAIVHKEQIARETIRVLKAILASQAKSDSNENDYFPISDSVVHEFPLAKRFFQNTLEHNFAHLEYILPSQARLRRRFLHCVEVVLLCFYDQHKEQVIFETIDQFTEKSFQRKYKLSESQGISGTTDLVNEKISSLLIKDLKKFVKIFFYLKIRADMRAMDVQVLQNRESNPAKAVEAQIIICCKVFQHIAHFSKFVSVQFHVRRSLALLTHLMFHTDDIIRPDLRCKVLLPVIKMIKYNQLGRNNKQILNSLLELCKQRKKQGFEQIIEMLEHIIFDLSHEAVSVKPEEPSDQKVQFEQMLKEVLSWLNLSILPQIDFKGLNRKGHRRCIVAKKQLFELAAKMSESLNLPLTSFSLFYRGANFEIKHANTFGISEEDIETYLELLKKGEIPAEERQSQLLSPQVDPDVSRNQDLADQSNVSDAAENDDLEKTYVDRMAKRKITIEQNMEVRLPNLELEYLCMGHKQLYNQADMPKNLDASDIYSNKGQATIVAEIRGIQQRNKEKREKKEGEESNQPQTDLPKNAEELKASAYYRMIESKKKKEHIREKSISQLPSAFQNQVNLANISQEANEEETEKMKENPQANSNMDGSNEKLKEPSPDCNESTIKMGRILPQRIPGLSFDSSKITKVTLRKNSARRPIAAAKPQVRKYEKKRPAGLPNGIPRPPKPADPAAQAEAVQKEEAKAERNQKKAFNLVFLKKGKSAKPEKAKEAVPAPAGEQVISLEKAGEQVKKERVKMPLMMLSKKIAREPKDLDQLEQVVGQAQNEQANITGSEAEGKKRKVKPFQIHLVKKKASQTKQSDQFNSAIQGNKGNRTGTRQDSDNYSALSNMYGSVGNSSDKEKVVKRVQNISESASNIGPVGRNKLMVELMGKLELIQNKADAIKKNLEETGPKETMQP